METDTAPHDPAPDATDGPVDEGGNPLLVDVPPELVPDRPPLVDAQGRVRLSFSRVDTFQNCPRKFRYRYVDRLPQAPAPALSFGSSVHSALEKFYDRKLPQEPSEDELLAFLYEGWDSSGYADLDRDEQLAYFRQAQSVLRRYHQRVTGRYRLPVAIEQWFELPVGDDAVVVGSIDRVDQDDDGRLKVVDYKTNKRVKTRERVAGSLQLAIYALACEHLYGELPVSVALDFVVPGVVVEVGVDEMDLDAARAAVLEVADAVLLGEYATTPNRLCDWCDFKAICPAWDEDDEGRTLGAATQEAASLRRSIARDLTHLRDLEAGVERLRAELDDVVAPPEPADPPPDGPPPSAPAPDEPHDDAG